MQFTITALDGDSVKVEADNWLSAMGKALPFFDVDVSGLGRVTCSTGEDGSIFVENGGNSWMVRPLERDVQVRVTAKSTVEAWDPRGGRAISEEDRGGPRPIVTMPGSTGSSLKKDEPKTLAEQLFELTTEIDELTPAQACDKGLGTILSLVRVDGCCALLGTLNDPALDCVAARGPRAGRFVGRKVGFGEGLLGMAFDLRETLLVEEVTSDTPHVDLAEGASLCVLCVPLLDDEGGACGVLQLVNPASRPFAQESVAVVEIVARTLANALSGR